MTTDSFALARQNMIFGQLHPNQVYVSSVLDAFARTCREDFVPPAFRDLAYMDSAISLGSDRWLMEPRIFARLVQASSVGIADRVLVVGCGSGYEVAVLGLLSGCVVGLESSASFAVSARSRLAGMADVSVAEGDLRHPPGEGSWDVVLLNGAVSRVPETLTRCLADGGRLVGVVRARERVPGQALLLEKEGSGVLGRCVLFDAVVPFLPDFGPSFSFWST